MVKGGGVWSAALGGLDAGVEDGAEFLAFAQNRADLGLQEHLAAKDDDPARRAIRSVPSVQIRSLCTKSRLLSALRASL
jgi:hypothetical protein